MSSGSCNLSGLVSVDKRGLVLLPKELRDKAGIKAGDKLALIACEKDGKICCFTFVKADDLAEEIKKKYGPVLTELFK
jgi:AbrB family looped-hinge helix DNA binding protein